MVLTRGAVRPDGTTAVAGVRWVGLSWSGDRRIHGRWHSATLVLALAVGPPLGVDDVLVVLDRPHVVERSDDGRDRPEERHHQLQEDPPEAEDVPEPEDPPERAVAAEGGVTPVEEGVEPPALGVLVDLERRVDHLPLVGRPADAGEEVLAHVFEQRAVEAAPRVVLEVRLARRGDRHDASQRGECEPQHRQQRATRVARPQEVPGEHADGHQVERQSHSRPGEAPRPRLLEVDGLGLGLTVARPGRPVPGLSRIVADLTAADPGPGPEHQLEAGAAQGDDRDQNPGPAPFGPLQRLLREDRVQEAAHPGEGRVAPQSQVSHPVHRRQVTDLTQRCNRQRFSPFRKIPSERRIPSQVSFIPPCSLLVNNII